VDESCWKNSPEVVAWMQAQGFSSPDQIYEYFVAEVDKFSLSTLNRSPIRWSEGARGVQG
jgi:N-acetyl-beta-hexosaminidase